MRTPNAKPFGEAILQVPPCRYPWPEHLGSRKLRKPAQLAEEACSAAALDRRGVVYSVDGKECKGMYEDFGREEPGAAAEERESWVVLRRSGNQHRHRVLQRTAL